MATTTGKVAVLGTVALLTLSACSAPGDSTVASPTVTVTATPQPTVTVTATPTEEPSETPTSTISGDSEDASSTPMSPAAFAVSARGDLRELLKDVDDARRALDEGGTFRLLGNAAEISFNIGQLQALDPPAAVATDWASELDTLDKAAKGSTDALSGNPSPGSAKPSPAWNAQPSD